jgi:hypothetical protein
MQTRQALWTLLIHPYAEVRRFTAAQAAPERHQLHERDPSTSERQRARDADPRRNTRAVGTASVLSLRSIGSIG